MAARLEAAATTTVVIWTTVGVVVGVGALAAVGLAFGNAVLGALVGLVVGGAIGYLVGEHRALMLRFEAQLALCYVAIEENTRTTSQAPPDEPTPGDGASGTSVLSIGTASWAGEPERRPDHDQAAPGQEQVNPGKPMTMPSGEWRTSDSQHVSGRYDVLSGDQRDSKLRALIGQRVLLDKRYGGVWFGASSVAGFLVPDVSYRWAVSVADPGLLLLKTADGEPVALLRRGA